MHLCFLVHGDSEGIGGFSTTIRGIIDLVGNELTWAKPIAESDEEPATEEEPEREV